MLLLKEAIKDDERKEKGKKDRNTADAAPVFTPEWHFSHEMDTVLS